MYLNKKQIKKLREFTSEYEDYFGKGNKDIIFGTISNFFPDYDFLTEICTYLFSEEFHSFLYTPFIKYLELLFPDIDERKILEVASGYIPGLSIELLKSHDIKNPITCMDPRNIPIEIPGIINKRSKFLETTDTSKIDLITAFCPCDALPIIAKKAVLEQKEICVQSCVCMQDQHFTNHLEFVRYMNDILCILRKLETFGFDIDCTNIETAEILSAPVISVRKKKR